MESNLKEKINSNEKYKKALNILSIFTIFALILSIILLSFFFINSSNNDSIPDENELIDPPIITQIGIDGDKMLFSLEPNNNYIVDQNAFEYLYFYETFSTITRPISESTDEWDVYFEWHEDNVVVQVYENENLIFSTNYLFIENE